MHVSFPLFYNFGATLAPPSSHAVIFPTRIGGCLHSREAATTTDGFVSQSILGLSAASNDRRPTTTQPSRQPVLCVLSTLHIAHTPVLM